MMIQRRWYYQAYLISTAPGIEMAKVGLFGLERSSHELVHDGGRNDESVIQAPNEAVAARNFLERDERTGVRDDLAWERIWAHAPSSVSMFSGESTRIEKP